MEEEQMKHILSNFERGLFSLVTEAVDDAKRAMWDGWRFRGPGFISKLEEEQGTSRKDAADELEKSLGRKRGVRRKGNTLEIATGGAKSIRVKVLGYAKESKKHLAEMKITDHEGNTFEVHLVDDGTDDTIIDIGGVERKFDSEFAAFWRDEEGQLSEEGLKQLALDVLSNMEKGEYNELVARGAEAEEPVEPNTRRGTEYEGRETEEGYKRPGWRDGTGPAKRSAQRSISRKGKRKLDGEKCPYGESKVVETEDIKQMYRSAGLPVPKGKGIHTKAFHELAINVAKGYLKDKSPEEAMDLGYATAMKQLGKEKAVKKGHRSSESKTNEGYGDLVGFAKEVWEVEFEKEGKKDKTRVMAHDKVDAKKEMEKKPGVKVLSVKKITSADESKDRSVAESLLDLLDE